MWRPKPPSAYRPSGRQLIGPPNLPAALASVFQPFAIRRLEACCFLFGEETGPIQEVKLIAIPPQKNSRGNYSVPSDGTRKMALALSGKGLAYLAQVHTHPGVGVEHSRYDDAHANSTRGFSIVLPRYGADHRPWPQGVGIHEFQGGYWHLIPASVGAALVPLDPTLGPATILDLR